MFVVSYFFHSSFRSFVRSLCRYVFIYVCYFFSSFVLLCVSSLLCFVRYFCVSLVIVFPSLLCFPRFCVSLVIVLPSFIYLFVVLYVFPSLFLYGCLSFVRFCLESFLSFVSSFVRSFVLSLFRYRFFMCSFVVFVISLLLSLCLYFFV